MVKKPKFDPDHTGWKDLHWWKNGKKYTNIYGDYTFPDTYYCYPFSMERLTDSSPNNVWLCEKHLQQAIERGYLW